MDKIVIEGGNSLSGEVDIAGSKNAALPILVSSLLASDWCEYKNVPKLKDILSILDLLKYLGCEVETNNNTIRINAGKLNNHLAPYDLVRKMRASILVLCPLVARLKKAKVSLPGGCSIGARPIDLHLKGLRALGAEIELDHGYVKADADKLKGCDYYFDFPSVTGTENLLMAAVLADGKTCLRNVAMEPEIIALCDVLNKMGANIKGGGTSKITIYGVKELSPVSVEIIPDRIETGTFMVAAAITGSRIKINNCNTEHLGGIINKLRQTGTIIEQDGLRSLTVDGKNKIKSINIETLPYPGFPTDMQAQFMVLMSVADGISIVSETIFENRFIHVSELKRMGADITVSGRTAMVKGIKKLNGAQVMASDLRASASLILAGLIADKTTEVFRVYHLDRGYEAIEKKLQKLGANIVRVKV